MWQRFRSLLTELRPPRADVRVLLQSTDVGQAIAREAQRSGRDQTQIAAEAAQILERLLPNFHPRAVRWLNRLATPLFRHMFQTLELHGLEQIQALSRTHQLIYLPCHRSHMDYLLLGWIQRRAQLNMPCVVAGDNLYLPLIGPLLQRGGALFMRRQFRDDPFYSDLFRVSMGFLLRNQRPLEYFIEGGRSRTGRLLPAKLGLLSITLKAPHGRGATPLALLPMAINYDRCLENRAYQRELAGQPKRPESLLNALASASALFSRCGGVYLQLGTPILLEPESGTAPLSPPELADRVLRHINAASIAAPMAQVATLLLASPGVRLDELLLCEQLEQLNRLLSRFDVPLPSEQDPTRWIHGALQRRQIHRLQGQILATPSQAAGLCFYRNTLLHALVLPGLYLLLATRLPRPGKASITRILRGLLPYLEAEFHLVPQWLDESMPTRLRKGLLEQGLLTETAAQVQPAPAPLALMLMRVAEPVLLRQYLLVRLLDHHRTIGEHQLLDLAAALATHIHRWYGHSAPDYADPRQLKLLVEQFQAGHLLRRKQGRIEACRDLAPIIRIGAKLLPAVLVQECSRWLSSH